MLPKTIYGFRVLSQGNFENRGQGFPFSLGAVLTSVRGASIFELFVTVYIATLKFC